MCVCVARLIAKNEGKNRYQIHEKDMHTYLCLRHRNEDFFLLLFNLLHLTLKIECPFQGFCISIEKKILF